MQQSPIRKEKNVQKPTVVKSSASSVRSSQIFYNIADDDMAEFFIDLIQQKTLEQENQDMQKPKILPQQQQNEEEVYQEIKEAEDLPEQTNVGRESIESNDELKKQNYASRLQIEIQKHKLNFISVYGEIFIKIIHACLINDKKIQKGLVLLTNYRMVFFKNSQKKVDLPFGYISHTKMNDKNLELTAYLKSSGNSWKFSIEKETAFKELKIFLAIYLKAETPKSSFAFAYGQKCPQDHIGKIINFEKQYLRLAVFESPQFEKIINNNFEICETYPQIFFIPSGLKSKVKKLAIYWNLCRFPILSFHYHAHHQSIATLWRSSYLCVERNQNLIDVAKYLTLIKGKSNITVCDCNSKALKKGVDEFELYSDCQMKYLNLEPLSNIKITYLSVIQCFFHSKKTFITDLLASKWYDGILNVLQGASIVTNYILRGNNVILKCPDGLDRSAQISAITQIILDPFYRTFSGFKILIQKQFRYFGHPFTTRLGLKSEADETIPIFIQFLDCISQLIALNPMSFEFNYKYLSKLSNLMYTCLFGTFISQNRKQIIQHKIDENTAPIWDELQSELTYNPYYQQKQGLLLIPHHYNEIRVWKQHFWYLTTPPKETYKIHPLAQDNHDYKSLGCLRIKKDNQVLKQQISNQRKEINKLKIKLEQRKNNKS